MAFWLLKTEPPEFSYSDLERRNRAVWDGVANITALMHLRAMRKGDRALIYHSGKKVKEFASFDLLRISRLSVMPVPAHLWKELLAMAN